MFDVAASSATSIVCVTSADANAFDISHANNASASGSAICMNYLNFLIFTKKIYL